MNDRTFGFYIVKDQQDGSLLFHRGTLLSATEQPTTDQRCGCCYYSRPEAAVMLHRSGLHQQGWRILKLRTE